MNIEYHGPYIRIQYDANELSQGYIGVKLADGYSYECIYIYKLDNITQVNYYQSIKDGTRLIYPPVNCKSPSILFLFVGDVTKPSSIRLSIEKFGQIPDEHYFDNTFRPILVTGDDGNKYKMIPSDQFK